MLCISLGLIEVYATCVHHLSSVGGASTFGWYMYGRWRRHIRPSSTVHCIPARQAGSMRPYTVRFGSFRLAFICTGTLFKNLHWPIPRTDMATLPHIELRREQRTTHRPQYRMTEARRAHCPRHALLYSYAMPLLPSTEWQWRGEVRESETVRVRDHSISPFTLLSPPARFFQRGERGRGGSLQHQRERESERASKGQQITASSAPPRLPEFSISPRRQKKAAFGGNLLEHCGGERDLPRRASCCSGPAAPACHCYSSAPLAEELPLPLPPRPLPAPAACPSSKHKAPSRITLRLLQTTAPSTVARAPQPRSLMHQCMP
jgi:hypothetical protein